MMPCRLTAALIAVAMSQVSLSIGAAAAQEFPMGQVLVLDAQRIGPLKRVPSVMIESDGRATVELWCKTVPALFEVSGPQIRIQTAPLPEAMPQYMSSGQCSPERMQADVDFLNLLTQASEWRRQGDSVLIAGADGSAPLRFRVSSH